MRRSLTRAACLTLLAIVAGCPDPDPAVPPFSMASHCGTDTETGIAPGNRLHAVASVGDSTPLEFQKIVGVATTGDTAFVWDYWASRVVKLDRALTPLGGFGREGDGPGEFRRRRALGEGTTGDGGAIQWIASTGDTLAVFDGRRIQRFATSGEALSSIETSATSPMDLWSARFFLVPGGVLWPAGGYSPLSFADREHPVFSIWLRLADEAPRPIFELPLKPSAVDASGVPVRTPAQARPLWDYRDGCIAVSDGESGTVYVASLAGTVDTINLDIPRRDVLEEWTGEIPTDLRAPGMGRRFPRPGAVRHLADLRWTPTKELWLLPIQPEGLSGRHEIIRVRLLPDGYETHVDTVPGFPLAFFGTDEYLALTRDTLGSESVRLVTGTPSSASF